MADDDKATMPGQGRAGLALWRWTGLAMGHWAAVPPGQLQGTEDQGSLDDVGSLAILGETPCRLSRFPRKETFGAWSSCQHYWCPST